MSAKNESIWEHYDRELRTFYRDAQDFAQRHKAEAAALGLGGRGSADPHVQRMIEAFALLTARVRAKLDDDFPELIDAMLGVLYPHLLAPLPSAGIVQFTPHAGGAGLEKGLTLDPGLTLLTREVGESRVRCKYRTAYPVRLWPIELVEAQLQPPPYPWKHLPREALPGGARYQAILRLVFRATGGINFATLPLEALRIYLWGDNVLTASLHELLLNGVAGLSFRNDTDAAARPVALATVPFQPVGLGDDEGMLPYPPESSPAFRLLMEFFAYREKFLFLDLAGWREARAAGALNGSRVEVLVYLARNLPGRLDQDVGVPNFRLGATPVINLFKQTTEAIKVEHRRHDYPLVPDRDYPTGYEVVRVLDVRHADAATGEELVYSPFYSFRHAEPGRAFWYARRRDAIITQDPDVKRPRDHGLATDVDLHFVDLKFHPSLPADPTVVATILCCNRNLPRILHDAGESLEFEALEAVPARIDCLRPVTPTLRPRPGRGSYWKLVSFLNLNHLSLNDPELGLQAFKEYLALHNFADPEVDADLGKANQQVIEGVLGLTSGRCVELLQSPDGLTGFARGMEVELDLDDDKFAGLGSYLFASVLERFFAQHASINSFTRLKHHTRQAGPVKTWPVRSGSRQLI